MTLLSCYEIAGSYPDNILISTATDGNKWTSLMYMLRDDGHIHKLMLSFDGFPFDSEEIASEKMHSVAKQAIDYLSSKDLLLSPK